MLALPARDKDSPAPDVFSHDGKLLAGRGKNGIHLWDVAKRQTRFVLPYDNKSYLGPPVFSPDDKVLAVLPVGNGPIRLFNPATGKLLRELKRNHAYSQTGVFLPGGKTLVFVEGFAILRFLDVESGKEVRRLELKDDHYAIDDLAVSPDGKWLAVNQGGARRDQRMPPKIFRMLDLASGKEMYRLLTTDDYVLKIAFAPDGKTIVRGIQGSDLTKSRIEVIEPATGKILNSLKVPGWGIQNFSFRADSKVLATSGSDRNIRLWSFPDLRPQLPGTGHAAEVSSLAYTPDGKLLCSAGADGKVIIWDLKTAKPRHTWPIPIGWRRQVHVGPDARHFVCTLNNLHSSGTPVTEGFALIYQLETGKVIHKIEPVRGGTALSPDGKMFAAADKDHDIRLWQVATGKVLLTCKGQKADAGALAFSPDGLWLAAAGVDGTVRVWCAASGILFRTIQIKRLPEPGPGPKLQYAAHLAFTPDGSWLVVSYGYFSFDQTETWDVLAGTRVQSHQVMERFVSASFLGNRRTLLTVCLQSGTAVPELFDTLGKKRLGVLPAWASGATVHALAPDGKTLAIAQDGLILIGKTVDFLPARPAPVPIPMEELRKFWRDLGKSGPTGHEAFLVLAGGDKAVPAFLGTKLNPVKGPDPKELARWIVELDDNSFKTRQQAKRSLETWGFAVELPLRQGYQSFRTEGRAGAKVVLAKIEKNLTTENGLRELRAVAVLEAIGTADAREVLAKLAKGAPGARLTEAARQALAHLR